MLAIEPLTPAYGRDYKSLKAVQADFDVNKDFMTNIGHYTNKEDLKKYAPERETIRVRYNRLTKTGFIKIQP